MQTLSCKQELEIFNMKWLLFPHCFFDFFFKINRVEATDEINKLCDFHENLTRNTDFIA